MNSIYRQRVTPLIGLLICFSLAVPTALAQTADQDSCSKRPCTYPAGMDPGPTDPTLQAANQDPDASAQTGFLNMNTRYVNSLTGGAPIVVQQPKHLRLLYGASTSQGYDSDIAGPFQNIGTYTSTYEGYLAASWRFTRSYVILQQDSAYTHFGSSLLEGHGFHQTALLSSLDFDPNLNWIFEATSSIGNNTLTELIPLPQIVVNGIAVTSPNAAVAGLNLGFVWGTDIVSTLNWKPDAHDLFSFRAENANHQFYGLDLHDNLTTLQLTYQRGVSRNTYLGAYGLTRHQTGTVTCDSFGVGLIGSTKPTDRWFLEASGGPEFDSTGCSRHQGFELHVSSTYQLSRTSNLWTLVNREFSSGFVPNGTWQDDAGLGFSKQLTRRLWWDVGGGYVRGFVVSSVGYHGFYAETQLRQRLSNSFTLEGLYRRFDQSVTGLAVHRNIVLFTLRWSPPNHDARRTAMYPYRPAEAGNDYRSSHED